MLQKVKLVSINVLLIFENIAQSLDYWTHYDLGISRWLPCYSIRNRRWPNLKTEYGTLIGRTMNKMLTAVEVLNLRKIQLLYLLNYL